MGQQEEAQHRGVGDLVVEGLAVQVQKGGVDPNVVPTSGCQTLQLPEDTDGVSRGLDHVCLRQHVLGKGLQKHTGNGAAGILLPGQPAPIQHQSVPKVTRGSLTSTGSTPSSWVGGT